jgi:uncharacterized protein YndB with AHSA1/START domain
MNPWTFIHSVVLRAGPEPVFAALTEPSQLTQWFAQYVDIDPRPGGHYRFWGRHTFGNQGMPIAPQRIVRFERPQAIAYQWQFADAASDVEFSLESDSDSRTRLRVSHAFPELPKFDRPRELIEDLWRMSLGNLDAHLRGGAGVVLPDFADPRPEVRLTILIDAPRERVYQALTDPEQLNQWIAVAAAVDARVGGRYSYGRPGGPTRILELVPNEKLVIDWPDWRGDSKMPDTRIAWLLTAVGNKTSLTLIHSGFTRTADISDYRHGWALFIARLQSLVQRS